MDGNGDPIYEEGSVNDIDFYTPDPIKDTIELCDILFSKNFKYVRAEEGVHEETYKIFVNFVNYSDISYMPTNIYNRMETIEVDELKMTHPHFMLVDSYRVYTDPMTSYWRLEKSFIRTNMFMSYYSLSESADINPVKYDQILNTKLQDDILRFIRKQIIHNNELVVVGHYAFNYLIKKTGLSKYELNNYPYYQLISIDFEKDAKNIYQLLVNEYGDKMSVKEFSPFTQFFGRRIHYYYEKQVILKLYDNYDRCIVYKKSDKKDTFFGTSQLVILYMLIDYQYAIINKFKNEESNYLTMIVRLLKARNKYLDKKRLTVLDDTAFQEFVLSCIGKPKDMMREQRLRIQQNIKKGKRAKFSYNPSGKPIKMPVFSFSNSSGNEIINDKYKLLGKKV